MTYTIRKAFPAEVRPALALAWCVFTDFIAPDYEPIGAVNFRTYCIENEAYIRQLETGECLLLVALDGAHIIGMAAECGNGEIQLLFVDGDYHRRGIASALMSDMICALKLKGFDAITLESTPHALAFYEQYGFCKTSEAINKYGCIVTPMAYTPNEIWDVLDRQGNKTGRFIERGQPLSPGEYYLVVHVWKRNANGEWLIDKRAVRAEDSLGGMWETTGGSAIAGDDSLTAALREAKEELGIDLDPQKGKYFCRADCQCGCGALVDVWVFDHDCPLSAIRFQEGETCDAMWASVDTIRTMMAAGTFLGEQYYPYFEEMIAAWVDKS